MKEMKSMVTNQIENLNSTEKKLLFSLFFLVLIAVGYFMVWEPLSDKLMTKQKLLAAERVNLEKIKNLAVEYIELSANNSSSVNVNKVITSSASRYNIDISRIQPQGNKTQVTIQDDVNFKEFINWIADFSQKKGIAVDTLDISVSQQKGFIKVNRLVLI